MVDQHEFFLKKALDLAVDNVKQALGGPFGAVIVKNGEVIASGANRVTTTNDPTAHAEVVVIRAACEKLGSFQLDDCELYTSCEPCPMCLAAIYWARIKSFYFAGDQQDAARAQFDDSFIYQEIAKPVSARSIPGHRLLAPEGSRPFDEWLRTQNKVRY